MKSFHSFHSVLQEISCRNGNPVEFTVEGVDAWDGRLLIEINTMIPSMPDNYLLSDLSEFFGWLLVEQVKKIYEAEHVPDDIIWHGHTLSTWNMN